MAALPWSLIALLPWLLVWLLLWPREELRGLFVPYVSSTSAQCGKLLGRRGEETDRRWRILTGLKPRMLMALHVNVWATVSAQPWFSRVGFSGKIWAWMLSFVAVRGVFGWLPLDAQHWLPSNRFLLLRWAAGRLARDASPFHRWLPSLPPCPSTTSARSSRAALAASAPLAPPQGRGPRAGLHRLDVDVPACQALRRPAGQWRRTERRLPRLTLHPLPSGHSSRARLPGGRGEHARVGLALPR